MYFVRSIFVAFILALLVLGCKPAGLGEQADIIYVGGPIVTMNDAQPSVEALAVKDGKILATGAKADIETLYKGRMTKVVDLAGKTLMPGFIDGHAHAQQFGAQAIGANLLAPS